MPEAARGQLHTGVHDDVVGHAPPGTEAPGTIALRPILITGACIAAFTAATLGGLHLYYRTEIKGPLQQAPRDFPEPRLQASPARDLARMLAEERARLEGYGWVDRERGIARIPVTEAMRLLAERGQAAYAAPVQPEVTPVPGSRGGARAASTPPDRGGGR
ncbi:hypothetical protein U8607_19860 [Methylobacterium durans]|uniref:hypothetical protein n=1 Tax=Methylobacterium durans TaxID=2202825 RepID=UPI002AFFC8C2|nr:hypothetical protein [Methylobacterium durans]MEA1834355.1 hypothetical protein [Methylobacterium durans]